MAEEEEDAGGGFRLSNTQSLISSSASSKITEALATSCALSLSFSLIVADNTLY